MSLRIFHYLCIALLLFAQQSAIVHATWHAAGDGHAHEENAPDLDNDDYAPGGQGSLCAFDIAFGQLLGGAHGSCAAPMAAVFPEVVASHTFIPRHGSEAVPALSRGPPLLL